MRPQRGSRPRSTTGDSTCCDAARARLERGHAHQPFDERGIPGARQPDRHGEVRAARRREPVQRLLVEHRRNAEPRVLDQPLLHGVHEHGVLARRPHRASGTGRAISLGRDTSPMPNPMSACAFVGIEPPLRVLDLALAVPDARRAAPPFSSSVIREPADPRRARRPARSPADRAAVGPCASSRATVTTRYQRAARLDTNPPTPNIDPSSASGRARTGHRISADVVGELLSEVTSAT